MGSTKVESLSAEDYIRIAKSNQDLLMRSIPELIKMDTQFAPQMAQNELDRQQSLFQGIGDTPGLLDISDQVADRVTDQNLRQNQALREADLAAVEANAGRVRGAIEGENRGLFDLMEAQEEVARQDLWHRDYADKLEGRGVHELHDLRQTALDDVARGGRLSAEQMRDVQQQSRAADNSRGKLRSGLSIGNEILNTERARKQNLAFADQRLMGMENALNSTRSRQMALRDHLTNNLNRSIDNRQRTFIDTFQGVLGRQAVNQSTTGGLFNQGNFANQMSQRPGFMNDFNAMNSSMATNMMDARMQTGRNNAGIWSGVVGGFASPFGDWLFNR